MNHECSKQVYGNRCSYDGGIASLTHAARSWGSSPHRLLYMHLLYLWIVDLFSLLHASSVASSAASINKMRPVISSFLWLCISALTAAQTCPDYAEYAAAPHAPFSGGVHNLSYQRPAFSCRTFTSPAVESTIARLTSTIVDPDLSRLFENSFPNTLDTAIKWKGYAADNADEELTFVITGDMYRAVHSYGVQYH